MKNLWSSIKAEFRRENFSLNFERNSQFLQKDPEEVLEYFHSAIVSAMLLIFQPFFH